MQQVVLLLALISCSCQSGPALLATYAHIMPCQSDDTQTITNNSNAQVCMLMLSCCTVANHHQIPCQSHNAPVQGEMHAPSMSPSKDAVATCTTHNAAVRLCVPHDIRKYGSRVTSQQQGLSTASSPVKVIHAVNQGFKFQFIHLIITRRAASTSSTLSCCRLWCWGTCRSCNRCRPCPCSSCCWSQCCRRSATLSCWPAHAPCNVSCCPSCCCLSCGRYSIRLMLLLQHLQAPCFTLGCLPANSSCACCCHSLCGRRHSTC